MRRQVSQSPDPALYEDKVKRLKALVKLWQNDHIDLLFGDETGFNLSSNVPYAWQPVGEQIGIRSKRKHVLNVFGLMSADNRLRFYPSEETINSDFIIRCLDDFAAHITRPSVIVWDKAPWHTSNEVMARRSTWEEKGLFIFFLPPYSPHLNKEETLWRKVKYEWLKPQHYRSKNTLKKAVINILSAFGTQYKINFSMNY